MYFLFTESMLYYLHADVAQWIERPPPERKVAGSSPTVSIIAHSQPLKEFLHFTKSFSCRLHVSGGFFPLPPGTCSLHYSECHPSHSQSNPQIFAFHFVCDYNVFM